MNNLYIVEARKEDGSLDVKRIGAKLFVNWPAFGVPVDLMKYINKQSLIEKKAHTWLTEDELYDFYFVANPDVESWDWKEMVSFYEWHGLYIRAKTW